MASPNPRDNTLSWKITRMKKHDIPDIARWIAALRPARKLEAPLIAAQLREEYRQSRKDLFPDFFIVCKGSWKIAFLTGHLPAPALRETEDAGNQVADEEPAGEGLVGEWVAGRQLVGGRAAAYRKSRDYKARLLLNPLTARWEENYQPVWEQVLRFIFLDPSIDRVLTDLDEADKLQKAALEQLGFQSIGPTAWPGGNTNWYACLRLVHRKRSDSV
ncbi:MAG: hypothetical protein P4L51_10895 [Puia sp.]|nr:hypothetical protein [Puia sp.]